VITGLVVALRS